MRAWCTVAGSWWTLAPGTRVAVDKCDHFTCSQSRTELELPAPWATSAPAKGRGAVVWAPVFGTVCVAAHRGARSLFVECRIAPVTLSHMDQKGPVATGPQILPENIPTAGVQPPCAVSIASAQAMVPLSPPCPTPDQGCLNTQRIRARGKAHCGGMWPVPKPASERFCSPKEAGGEEAGGPRSNLLSLTSQQMRGTVKN